MLRLRLGHLLIALCLPLVGTAGAAMHDGGGLNAFPGQAAVDVSAPPPEWERGYDALFVGDESHVLQVPFEALSTDGSPSLVYGPLLRYPHDELAYQPSLPGLDERNQIEAGGFLAWRRGPWQVHGSALGGNPLVGDAGLLGLSGSYALQSSDRLTLVLSGRASWASDDYLRRRALDDPDLAGVPVNGGGVSDLGLSVNASYRSDSDWSLVGMFGMHHTLASDGGLQGVLEQGTRFRAGATFRYHF